MASRSEWRPPHIPSLSLPSAVLMAMAVDPLRTDVVVSFLPVPLKTEKAMAGGDDFLNNVE